MTIKCISYTETKTNGKAGGIYEITLNGFHKHIPVNELLEKSNAKHIDETDTIEDWLNTEAGIDWATTVQPATINFLEYSEQI